MNFKLPIIIALIGGTVIGFGTTELLHSTNTNAASCLNPGVQSQSRNIMIMDGQVEPTTTSGKLCDTVTFTNMDTVSREIAFGPHDNHVPYDGVAEKVLNKGESFTITLNKVGNVKFHDHLHEEVAGQINVTK